MAWRNRSNSFELRATVGKRGWCHAHDAFEDSREVLGRGEAQENGGRLDGGLAFGQHSPRGVDSAREQIGVRRESGGALERFREQGRGDRSLGGKSRDGIPSVWVFAHAVHDVGDCARSLGRQKSRGLDDGDQELKHGRLCLGRPGGGGCLES